MENNFWELICQGVTQVEAAERAGAGKGTMRKWLTVTGGIRPRLVLVVEPGLAARSRCLTEFEREEIALGRAAGHSLRRIGRDLQRDVSTISREIARNATTMGPRAVQYRGGVAQSRAEQRRRRPKARKLACARIWSGSSKPGWTSIGSPRQVVQRMRLAHPKDPEQWVSHETIYQCLYVQGRGGLRRDLHKKLRTGRALRRPRAAARRAGTSSVLPDPVSISERPAEAADRAVPGHWEGDLIVGKDSGSAIGTLVERSTRYCLLLHLPGRHGAEQVRDAMITAICTLPEQLWRSLTWDRGVEMARHPEITLATGLQVYFCDPHSPWQRGSNENTNGLLRQYFPTCMGRAVS